MRFLIETFFKNIDYKEFSKIFEDSEKYKAMGISASRVISALEDFTKEYKSYDKLISFIENDLKLPYIGQGSQRKVYDIDADHVLKLALHPGGVEANARESDPKVQSLLRGVVPKVYAADSNKTWVVMDKVKSNVNRYDWINDFFGVDLPDGNYEYLFNSFIKTLATNVYFGNSIEESYENSINVVRETIKKDQDFFEELGINYKHLIDLINKFMNSKNFELIIRLMSEFGPNFARILADLHRGNLGRLTDGTPVILDWG